MTKRLERMKKLGLIGCLNNSGITSTNYKHMEWINEKDNPAPSFIELLVVVKYLDASWDYENGGYKNEESFWTPDIIMISMKFSNRWKCGGEVTHWMFLPSAPKAQ